ncbi:hypothetical protein N0V85_006698 [Neurospora sp. IMI 360204]|nr:hypothetical protein N0V85_006698 [Neurospora sp. IMI 360204]
MSPANDRAGNAQRDRVLDKRRTALHLQCQQFREELNMHLQFLGENGFNIKSERDPNLNIVAYWDTFARKEHIMAMADMMDLKAWEEMMMTLMDNARECH